MLDDLGIASRCVRWSSAPDSLIGPIIAHPIGLDREWPGDGS